MHIPRSFVSIKFQFVADKNNFCARETWMDGIIHRDDLSPKYSANDLMTDI